jgi:5-oxoprolinase (ATP-hydrolysing)
MKVVEAGRSKFDDLERLLRTAPYPSRAVADNLADVSAQIAANRQGALKFLRLVEHHGRNQVLPYMRHVQDATAEKLTRELALLKPGRRCYADYLDDGSAIAVSVEVSRTGVTIDFEGSAPVHSGNLNANRAIVRAAVIYVLRCLIAEDIPLNDGILQVVQLSVPTGILSPPDLGDARLCAAVAGGNVETSQRIVDVLLGAFGLAAASQGTMNNVVFGDATFGYYETIGGGAGATKAAAGADAVHTHMTNTRMTDPEILEQRYPIRVLELSIRPGSGGAGRHRGGHGIIRRLEFLHPVDLSILSQRRVIPPYGLAGGLPGATGHNVIHRSDGTIEELAGIVSTRLEPGDILIIETPGGGGWGSPG